MDFENNQFPQQTPVQPQQAPFQAPVQPQQAPYAPVAPQQTPFQAPYQVPQQAPFQAPYQAPQQAPAQLPQANKGKSKLPMLIGVVAVVAIVAVLAVVLLGGSGYKKALENYLESEYKDDTSNIESLLPDSVWEEFAERRDMEKEDIIDEYIELKEEVAEIKEENDWSYEYEIVSYEKMDDGDLDDIKDGLEDMYDIDPDSVGNKGYVAEVEIKFIEDDETEEDDFDAYIVKIDGDWYVVDEDGWFMF